MTEETPLINLNKDRRGVYGWLRLSDYHDTGVYKILFKLGNKKIPAEIRISANSPQMASVEIAEKTLHFRRIATIDRRLIEQWEELYNATALIEPHLSEVIRLC